MAHKLLKKQKFKPKDKQLVSFRSRINMIQSRIIADIKMIRLRWAEGCSDMEIREELGLVSREWKRRIRIMRSVPADDDVIKSFKRYSYEHEKTVSKMQQRLKELDAIYKKANQEISFDVKIGNGKKKEIVTHARDLHLAATVQKNMHEIDRDMLKAEADFIVAKQRLGMIEMPEKEEFDPFADQQVVTAPNLMMAWKLRKERDEAKKLAEAKDISPAVIIDEKQKVNGKDRSSKR